VCRAEVAGGNAEFFVAALGVGTKFLSLAADRQRTEVAGEPAPHSMIAVAAALECGDALRDLHAEVLARRAFMRFLHLDAARCLSGKRGVALGLKAGSTSCLRVRDGVTFHFYSSSVPCGNACIRRRAKG